MFMWAVKRVPTKKLTMDTAIKRRVDESENEDLGDGDDRVDRLPGLLMEDIVLLLLLLSFAGDKRMKHKIE